MTASAAEAPADATDGHDAASSSSRPRRRRPVADDDGDPADDARRRTPPPATASPAADAPPTVAADHGRAPAPTVPVVPPLPTSLRRARSASSSSATRRRWPRPTGWRLRRRAPRPRRRRRRWPQPGLRVHPRTATWPAIRTTGAADRCVDVRADVVGEPRLAAPRRRARHGHVHRPRAARRGTTPRDRSAPTDHRFFERLVAAYDAATPAFLAAGATDVLWVVPPIPADYDAAPARPGALARYADALARGRRRATRVRSASSIWRRGSPPSRRRRSGPTACTGRPAAATSSPTTSSGRSSSTPRVDVTRYATGLVIGRFDPPHLGHSFLIDRAAERCERLVVFVNSSAARDAAPGHLRARVARRAAPGVTVVEVVHDLPTDFGDEALWQRWIDLFRDHWPFGDRPDVVCSSDPYVAELARRLGAEPVVVDADRAQRPDQRDDDPQRPGRAPGDAGPAGAGVGRGELGVSERQLSARLRDDADVRLRATSTRRGRSPWPARRSPSRR